MAVISANGREITITIADMDGDSITQVETGKSVTVSCTTEGYSATASESDDTAVLGTVQRADMPCHFKAAEASGSNALITLEIDEEIYDDDTAVTVSAEAGAFYDGVAYSPAVEDEIATNTSTVTYPKASMNWLVVPHRVVRGTFMLEVAAAQLRSPSSDATTPGDWGIAGIVFIVTDGVTTKTKTITDTSLGDVVEPTSPALTAPGARLPALQAERFAATFYASDFVDGDLTCRVIAYPKLGDAASRRTSAILASGSVQSMTFADGETTITDAGAEFIAPMGGLAFQVRNHRFIITDVLSASQLKVFGDATDYDGLDYVIVDWIKDLPLLNDDGNTRGEHVAYVDQTVNVPVDDSSGFSFQTETAPGEAFSASGITGYICEAVSSTVLRVVVTSGAFTGGETITGTDSDNTCSVTGAQVARGNDGTGTIDNELLPYATFETAAHALPNDGGGHVVKLKSGWYQPFTGSYSARTQDVWITIAPWDGTFRNTSLASRVKSGVWTKMRFLDLSIVDAEVIAASTSFGQDNYTLLYFDRCRLARGNSSLFSVYSAISHNDGTFFTGCSSESALVLFRGALLVRDSFGGVGWQDPLDYGASLLRAMHNVSIPLLTNGETSNHVDLWQPEYNNGMPHNITLVDVDYACYQTVGKGGGIWVFGQADNLPKGTSIAIVNCRVHVTHDGTDALSGIGREIDGLIVWHCSFTTTTGKHAFEWVHQENAAEVDQATNHRSVDFVGSLMTEHTAYVNSTSPESDGVFPWSFRHVHIENGLNDLFGSDTTVGDPLLIDDLVPAASSPLSRRLSSPVKYDLAGRRRPGMAAVGPFEPIAETGSNPPIPVLFARRNGRRR